MRASLPEPTTVMTGIAFGESPRWHDGRLWFADWGTQEVVSVGPDGAREVVLSGLAGPISIDWLPDGRLLAVAGAEGRLLRREPDGSLATHADLSALSAHAWNEIVVDARGNAFVNTIGFDFATGQDQASGSLAVVAPDGSVRPVADRVSFPNGMAITPGGGTLILAESYANRLTAFDVDPDGSLANRRVWADLGDGCPDGICLDAEGAVWYADVPNARCVRVREGGEVLQAVQADRGCFACMLGGPEGTTLFVMAREWSGPEGMEGGDGPTGVVLAVEAPAPHAGRP
ncbi:MAG TPA: SMP-30/gluconolactonase/LRE family protein [Acidimicrobiales bacterium]